MNKQNSNQDPKLDEFLLRLNENYLLNKTGSLNFSKLTDRGMLLLIEFLFVDF